MEASIVSIYGPPAELYPDMPYGEELLRICSGLDNVTQFMLDRHVEAGLGDKLAVVTHEVRRTYSELLADVEHLAKSMQDLGLEKGDRVLTKLSNSYELILTILATLRIGAVTVPCHPLLSKREIEYIANNSEAKLIVTDKASAETLQQLAKEIVTVDEVSSKFRSLQELMHGGRLRGYTAVHQDEAAVILYTSGTTGKPKGCIHSHKEYIAVAYCYAEKTLGCTQCDVVSGIPSVAFAFGHTGLFGNPLILGGTTVLIPRFEPRLLLEVVEREKINILLVTPTSMKMILKDIPEPRREYDLTSLRLTLSAGEVCPPALHRSWSEKIGCTHLQHIGSTEMFNGFISTTPTRNKPGSLGFPVYGYSVKIVKEDWNECKANEEGLLLVKGPTGTRYWRDNEMQRRAVREGWNITGDVCYRDEEGFIWYVGRADDIIKSAGYRISPTEVEDALLEHPYVADAAVVGVPDENRGQVIKAYIVLKVGCSREKFEKEVKDFLSSRVARYKLPRIFEFVDELPKTVTGKVRRVELRDKSG